MAPVPWKKEYNNLSMLYYRTSAEYAGRTKLLFPKEGKFLLACEADPSLSDDVREALSAGPPLSDANVEMILGRVLATDALAASVATAERHAEAAVGHLHALPASPARDALIDLAHGSARRRR